jgi:hypothetical protein
MSNTASSTMKQPQPRFVLGVDRLSVADTTRKSIVDKTTSVLLCRTTNSMDAEFILNKLNSHERLVAALDDARELLALNGINSNDTADYGNGRADDIIGRIDEALMLARA